EWSARALEVHVSRELGRRLLRGTLCALAALTPAVGWAAAQDVVRVYAVINEDDARLLSAMFEAATGIHVQYLRASTGDLVSRVMAEAGNPQADILFGGPSSQFIALAQAGALAPYRSPLAEGLTPVEADPDGYWTGFYLSALGIGVNEERYRELFGDKPLPATWDDLLDTAYEGEIVITDPTASSTAYLF